MGERAIGGKRESSGRGDHRHTGADVRWSFVGRTAPPRNPRRFWVVMALATMLLSISAEGSMTANAINKPTALLIATPNRLAKSSTPSTPSPTSTPTTAATPSPTPPTSTPSTPFAHVADTYIARMSLDDK